MYLTEKKFEEYLIYLNHLSDEYSPWQLTQAKKEHIDEYGIVITKGQIYYTKPCNKNFKKLLKLSKQSMDQLLFLVVEGNDKLRLIGKRFEEIRIETLQKAIEKIF